MIAVPSRRLSRRVRAAFTERRAAKLAALVLAVALWLVVTLESPLERWVEVRLDLSVDSGYALAESAPRVRALVAGRGRELLELYSDQPAAHLEAGNAGNDIAVIGIAPSDIELPPGVDVRVRDVRPRLVRIKLKRIP